MGLGGERRRWLNEWDDTGLRLLDWSVLYGTDEGKRLMFDTGQPGRVRNLSGVPPLRVNIGLASAVNAQVDEKPIVIPRRAGKDGAKFLIEADGSVRPDTLKTAVRE